MTTGRLKVVSNSPLGAGEALATLERGLARLNKPVRSRKSARCGLGWGRWSRRPARLETVRATCKLDVLLENDAGDDGPEPEAE